MAEIRLTVNEVGRANLVIGDVEFDMDLIEQVSVNNVFQHKVNSKDGTTSVIKKTKLVIKTSDEDIIHKAPFDQLMAQGVEISINLIPEKEEADHA